MNLDGTATFLLVQARSRRYALGIEEVVEIMRPLAVEPFPGLPEWLSGVSLIRGGPVPVVDLSRLLGGGAGGAPGRFVLLRVGDRRVALAVEHVLGFQVLAEEALQGLPPLLQRAEEEAVAALGASDQQLLTLLAASRLIPSEAWEALEAVP